MVIWVVVNYTGNPLLKKTNKLQVVEMTNVRLLHVKRFMLKWLQFS